MKISWIIEGVMSICFIILFSGFLPAELGEYPLKDKVKDSSIIFYGTVKSIENLEQKEDQFTLSLVTFRVLLPIKGKREREYVVLVRHAKQSPALVSFKKGESCTVFLKDNILYGGYELLSNNSHAKSGIDDYQKIKKLMAAKYEAKYAFNLKAYVGMCFEKSYENFWISINPETDDRGYEQRSSVTCKVRYTVLKLDKGVPSLVHGKVISLNKIGWGVYEDDKYKYKKPEKLVGAEFILSSLFSQTYPSRFGRYHIAECEKKDLTPTAAKKLCQLFHYEYADNSLFPGFGTTGEIYKGKKWQVKYLDFFAKNSAFEDMCDPNKPGEDKVNIVIDFQCTKLFTYQSKLTADISFHCMQNKLNVTGRILYDIKANKILLLRRNRCLRRDMARVKRGRGFTRIKRLSYLLYDTRDLYKHLPDNLTIVEKLKSKIEFLTKNGAILSEEEKEIIRKRKELMKKIREKIAKNAKEKARRKEKEEKHREDEKRKQDEKNR